MEHVSRLISATIDTLLLVAEPTVASARAVGRICELTATLPMRIGRRMVVWNKVTDGVPDRLREMAGEDALDGSVEIPYDKSVLEAHADGSLSVDKVKLPEVAELAELCSRPGSSVAT